MSGKLFMGGSSIVYYTTSGFNGFGKLLPYREGDKILFSYKYPQQGKGYPLGGDPISTGNHVTKSNPIALS